MACSKSWAWRSKAVPILRALDKLPKIGARSHARRDDREGRRQAARQADRVLALAGMRGQQHGDARRASKASFGGNPQRGRGHRATCANCSTWPATPALPTERIVSICRSAAAWITTPAPIYETFLSDKPDIGSVCSGGRYDNLAGLYTKQELPGVGASLGLDRLLAAMEEMNLLPKVGTPAPVLIVQFAAEHARRVSDAWPAPAG